MVRIYKTMHKILSLLSTCFFILNTSSICQEIQVTIQGRDDGIKSSVQQDYKEAVMNAKLEAIERAGSEILSITRIVNFQMKYNSVESKAEAVLLPGYEIMDIGYQSDGTYLIILTGKIRVGEMPADPSTLYNKGLVLIRQDSIGTALKNFKKIIKDHPESDYGPKSYEQVDRIKKIISKEWDHLYLSEGIEKMNLLKKLINNGYDFWEGESVDDKGCVFAGILSPCCDNLSDGQMVEFVNILINNGYGRYLNDYEQDGRCSEGLLHKAVDRDYYALAKTLLDAGMNVNPKRPARKPLRLANSEKMRKLLKKYGATE